MSNIEINSFNVEYEIIYKKIKNLYMRVRNNKLVITSPRTYSKKDIETFILKHQNFVIINLNKDFKDLYSEDYFLLWGMKYKITKYQGKSLKICDDECFIPVNYSTKMIELYYQNATIEMAKSLIENDLKLRMREFNLSKVEIKAQKMSSRLGSCKTAEGRIKLNSVLARFDIKFLRAILVHEIVHLKIKNHQKEFYDVLIKYEPNYKKIRKEITSILKHYQL